MCKFLPRRGKLENTLLLGRTYTDNEAAIRTVERPSGKSGVYITVDNVLLIDRL
jgi:hypothetical protein